MKVYMEKSLPKMDDFPLWVEREIKMYRIH